MCTDSVTVFQNWSIITGSHQTQLACIHAVKSGQKCNLTRNTIQSEQVTLSHRNDLKTNKTLHHRAVLLIHHMTFIISIFPLRK